MVFDLQTETVTRQRPIEEIEKEMYAVSNAVASHPATSEEVQKCANVLAEYFTAMSEEKPTEMDYPVIDDGQLKIHRIEIGPREHSLWKEIAQVLKNPNQASELQLKAAQDVLLDRASELRSLSKKEPIRTLNGVYHEAARFLNLPQITKAGYQGVGGTTISGKPIIP